MNFNQDSSIAQCRPDLLHVLSTAYLTTLRWRGDGCQDYRSQMNSMKLDDSNAKSRASSSFQKLSV